MRSPARFEVQLSDLVWDALYAPIAASVSFAADRLNVLQFLRRSAAICRFVFATLVALLLVLALWP